MPLIGDLAGNPGTCPDWESNWRPFGSQAGLSLLTHTSQGYHHYSFLMVKMSQICLAETHSSCTFFNMSPSIFEHFLAFWYKIIQAHGEFCLPKIWNIFPRILGSFSGKYLATKIWELGVLIAIGVLIAPKPSQKTDLEIFLNHIFTLIHLI